MTAWLILAAAAFIVPATLALGGWLFLALGGDEW